MSVIQFNDQVEVEKYIQNKLNKISAEHQEYFKETYYLGKELTKTQYEELISDIKLLTSLNIYFNQQISLFRKNLSKKLIKMIVFMK